MIVKFYNKTGKLNSEGYDLPNNVFGSKINNLLLAQYVYIYLANQRQSNANTKDRGEVSGGGKKPWNQKGTGRARAGSSRSPLWRSGGVTFGPSNEKNYKQTITKKMVKAAFRTAFSTLAKEEKVVVLEMIDLKQDTKGALKALGEFANEKGVVLVHNKIGNETIQSFRNIPNVTLVNLCELNPYILSNSRRLVLIEDTVEIIKKTWGGIALRVKKANEAKSTVKVEKKAAVSKPKAVKKVTSKKSSKKAE
jgi:large subunit ribosomal protein L4